MTKLIPLFIVGAALAGLSACGVSGQRAPNEFRIVTKAPLEVPPNYNLRPPRPGSSTPAEVAAARNDQAIAFGQELGQDASAAERLLVARAGANATNPGIRSLVDYEEAGVLRKSRGRVEQVLTGQGVVEDSATGDQPVTIQPGGDAVRVKLPGT